MSCPNLTATYDEDHLHDLLFNNPDISGAQIAVCSILCWIITSLAVAAGIGGGGLLVPLYFIALGVPQTRAVSLSKGTIFGVAVGNFFFISRERHPKADRPLIDYPTAIFMQGGELAGVVLGVLFNLLLPPIITIIISAIVLGFNSYKTLNKAIDKRKKETAAMLKAAQKAAEPAKEMTESSASAASPPPSPPEEPAQAEEVQVTVKAEGNQTDLAAAFLAEQAQSFPAWAWSLLALMCTFFIIYSLAIGKALDPEFTTCHPGYWPVYVLPFIFYGLIIAVTGKRNLNMHQRMTEAGVKPIEGDIVWNGRAIRLLAPAAVGAGIAAGLLGIGGGMILGPIFVALGFQPQVGTATTGFMILFTALGGTVKYLTIGKLPWRHFLWFASIGAIGGQTGQRVVKKLIQKTGRPSYVVFILGGIIGLAVIIMTIFGVIRVVDEANCGVDIWKAGVSQFECLDD